MKTEVGESVLEQTKYAMSKAVREATALHCAFGFWHFFSRRIIAANAFHLWRDQISFEITGQVIARNWRLSEPWKAGPNNTQKDEDNVED